MPRSYSKTVHISTPRGRSLAILALGALLVSGAAAGRDALGGRVESPAQAKEPPVVGAMPLSPTPEAESPVAEAPAVPAPQDVISVVESPATEPDVAQATQEIASTAQESPELVAGNTVVVTTEGLNVRTEPGLGGDIAVILPPGVQATVVAGPTAADNFTWYQLDANGVTGWSAEEYLAPAPPILAFAAQVPTVPLFPVGCPVVADGELHVRSGAGLAEVIQDRLPAGTVATVVGGPRAADGYTWYQLDINGIRGWSAGEFLTPLAGA
jgi:uncharacterized protein YraI